MRRPRMRRRTQPDDLRPEVDRPVVAVVGDVVQRDVDRHSGPRGAGRAGRLWSRPGAPMPVAHAWRSAITSCRRCAATPAASARLHAATGTRKSRLMPTPSVVDALEELRQERVQPGRQDLVDAAVLQVGAQPAGAGAACPSTARWRRSRRLRHHLVHAGGSERGMSARRISSSATARAGSRCGRPCGRPRSPRPSAGSPPVIEVVLLVLLAGACRRSRSARAWNFTSSSRAVLSARSRKVPMRRKWNASSCSIVPTVTPRDRCERNLTHSKNCARVALEGVRREHALEFEPGLVLRFPDLGGQRAAHRARVLARRRQAADGSTSSSSASLDHEVASRSLGVDLAVRLAKSPLSSLMLQQAAASRARPRRPTAAAARSGS